MIKDRKSNEKRDIGTKRALAEKLATMVLSKQRRMADRMNGWAGKMEPRLLKMILLVLGTLFGCYCAWLLISSIIS